MSEKHNHDYEQFISPESEQELQEQRTHAEAQNNTEPNIYAEKIERIRSAIEQEAQSPEAVIDMPKDNVEPHSNHHYITKKIKATQYKQTIKELQSSLTPGQKRFSTIIHRPIIERASEIGAQTIARPTGIIGGALVALIGSAVIMYIARHIGFEVPQTIFIVLFVTGFLGGVITEALIRLLKRRAKSKRSL